MARKNKKQKTKNKKQITKNRFFYIAIFSILLFLGFAYYNSTSKKSNDTDSQKTEVKKLKNKKQDKNSTKELMDKMKKMLKEQQDQLKKKKNQQIKKEKKKKTVEIKTKVQDKNRSKNTIKIKSPKAEEKHVKKGVVRQIYFSEIHDYEKSLKYAKVKHLAVKKTKIYEGKPKLSIIIDDVSFQSQVKQIKKIPFKVTPSFFPPTKVHPDTIKLSQEFKFAMIHLPLEAMGYAHPEPSTLLASDNKKTIRAKIHKIKEEFPGIYYYNNHTGSKFTANLKAMQNLISIMQSENLHFLDSRTTADTKAGVVSKAMHLRLLSRDVFLDNIAKPKEIIQQLKKAIKLAKKSGYAIAIGHPHKNTLKTLMGAKKYLKDVRLVYVNEL